MNPPASSPPRILHVDCDAFFCQCAYLTWPERLAGVDLLLVGGHPRRRGVVASCSYGARKRGVHSAMPMATALRICPEATAAPVPWAMVRGKSREVFRVLGRFAERLERVSVDEGYLLLPPGDEPVAEVARRIQRTVLEESAISVSIGGATRRFLAKLATGHAKPAGVFVVPPGEEYDFVGAHTLGDIPGIGPAFLRELARRGISSIASARGIDLPTLTLWLGQSRARYLYDRVRAIDPTPVSDGSEPRKSISSETTFATDLWEYAALEEALGELVTDVGHTLRKLGLRARTVGVKVRGSDFQDRQKNRTLPQAIATDRVIFALARELLREVRRVRPGPLRLLGVSLGKLEGPGSVEQLTFPEILPPLESDEERRLSRSSPSWLS
jgi:DNA polymerase IV